MSEPAATTADPAKLQAALVESTALMAPLEADRQAMIAVLGKSVMFLQRVQANRAAWKKIPHTTRTEIRGFLNSIGQ